MEKEFSIQDNQLKVVKTETVISETSYDLEFLKIQRNTIQAQKDRDNAQRDAELQEVVELLAEAEKVGLVEEREVEVVEAEIIKK